MWPFDKTPIIGEAPDSCDFEKVRDDLVRMLGVWREEASAEGQQIIFKEEVYSTIELFVSNPNRKHANSLLKVWPGALHLFQIQTPSEQIKLLGIALGGVIYEESAEGWNEFVTEHPFQNETDQNRARVEELIYLLHVCDRFVFERVRDLRAALMDAAQPYIQIVLTQEGLLAPDIDFTSLCNERQMEYANFVLFPEESEPVGKAVSWHACRHIGQDDPRQTMAYFARSLELLTLANNLVTYTIQELQTPKAKD